MNKGKNSIYIYIYIYIYRERERERERKTERGNQGKREENTKIKKQQPSRIIARKRKKGRR